MGYVKDKNIIEMFEGYGLIMLGNKAKHENHFLPTVNDLQQFTNSTYNDMNENLKLETIKRFLNTRNHFQIFDWKFFFTNLNFLNEYEKLAIGKVFSPMRIYYEDSNNSLEIYNYHPSDDFIKELAANKKIIKLFSKEFQAKAIFMSVDKLTINIKTEIAKLVKDKIIELGILEKMGVELPKLILKNLS